MSVRIERLLGIATLQGLPITGYRRFGVPPGGAFDQESLRIANALLGNGPGALAVELSNAAGELLFGSTTRVALVGAEAPNAVREMRAGDRFSFVAPRTGVRLYLAVSGGWIPDGIDSPLARSGRMLRVGDVLEHAETNPGEPLSGPAAPPGSLAAGPIRVLPGPQPLISIAGRSFDVSIHSDRAGIRLDGLDPFGVPELPSEPACQGAIQVTPSGQLIVIGPDGPTIGGYPKVAVVCSGDLDRLAQLRPGQSVSFEIIDFAAAKKLALDRESRISQIEREFRSARAYG